jgi:hypothetical protein
MRPPRSEDERLRFEGSRLVFVDSITPVVEAGQDYRWDGEHRIGDTLRLELAPGHTPGTSVLWLEDGDGAVFVGDLMHTPVQIARPNDACAFDLDADTGPQYPLRTAGGGGTKPRHPVSGTLRRTWCPTDRRERNRGIRNRRMGRVQRDLSTGT